MMGTFISKLRLPQNKKAVQSMKFGQSLKIENKNASRHSDYILPDNVMPDYKHAEDRKIPEWKLVGYGALYLSIVIPIIYAFYLMDDADHAKHDKSLCEIFKDKYQELKKEIQVARIEKEKKKV